MQSRLPDSVQFLVEGSAGYGIVPERKWRQRSSYPACLQPLSPSRLPLFHKSPKGLLFSPSGENKACIFATEQCSEICTFKAFFKALGLFVQPLSSSSCYSSSNNSILNRQGWYTLLPTKIEYKKLGACFEGKQPWFNPWCCTWSLNIANSNP